MISDAQDKQDRSKDKTKKDGQKRAFKPPKKISEKYLYNSGLHYLQRFPASTHHFKTVMMRKINKSCRHHTDQDKDECIKALDKVAEQFIELGLLNDDAYLKGMVTSYRRRGLSSMQIKMKLQQKGFSDYQVIEELKKFDREEFDTNNEGDLKAAMIFARRKKLGPYDINERKTPEQAMGAMARAGYSFDVTKKILNMDLEEIEKLSKRL